MGSLSIVQGLRPKAKPHSCGYRLFFALVLMMFLGASLAEMTLAATYSGKVVDAETGKPLQGAVIVVVWYKKAIYSMDGPEYFHNARETLTDREGNFSMDASEGINWNPLTWIETPRIAVYHPGYWPLSDAYPREFRDPYGMDDAMKKGAVVKLPKLKTDEELRKFADLTSSVSMGAPRERIPNLLRAVNVQRAMLGLKLLPETKEGGKQP